MNRPQRRRIYWDMYFILEAKECNYVGTDYMCHILLALNKPDSIEEYYPELLEQRPQGSWYAWHFPNTKLGDSSFFIARQEALLKAIALTYAAASPSIHVKKEDNEPRI